MQLSYQQFLAKHPVKFNGLSQAEKRKRYQDYLRATNGSSQPQSRPTPARRGRRRRGGGRQGGNPARTRDAAFALYSRMVAAPFESGPVGLPVFPSPPSAKVTGWIKGIANVGTSGFGFVLARPTCTSDATAISYSTGTYAGVSSDETGTGVSVAVTSNMPIAGSALAGENTALRVRCSTAALRVRYTGTENNLGGVLYGIVHPQHQGMSSQNVNTIQALPESTSFSVTREWTTLRWVPAFRNECDYYHTATPPSHESAHSNSGYPMVFMFTGTPGNSFEFQFISHWEFLGTGAVGASKTENQVSQNHADQLDKLQQVNWRFAQATPQVVMRWFLTSALMIGAQSFIASNGGL